MPRGNTPTREEARRAREGAEQDEEDGFEEEAGAGPAPAVKTVGHPPTVAKAFSSSSLMILFLLASTA